MLDRRDRATWGGRGGERGIGNMCFSTKDGGKVVVRVALLFLFILCLYIVRLAEFEGSQRGIFWVIGLFMLRLF